MSGVRCKWAEFRKREQREMHEAGVRNMRIRKQGDMGIHAAGSFTNCGQAKKVKRIKVCVDMRCLPKPQDIVPAGVVLMRATNVLFSEEERFNFCKSYWQLSNYTVKGV
jgi:hypothetical protein